MTYRREAWNRFLQTILKRIPPLITNYSASEQILISAVFEILSQGSVSTQGERDRFLASMDQFVRNTTDEIEYFNTPFLWFSNTFFLNARRLLVEASFHADNFIQYLVRVLRGDTNTQGVFQLLQNQTSLKDLKWELLQYYCNEIHDPLTETQINILRIIYSMVNSDPLRAMDQHYLTREIAKNVHVSKQFRGLHHLFSRLDARWGVWMFPEAFGISISMFKLNLVEKSKFESILDFNSPDNFVLGMSNVYSTPNCPNSFFGFIYTPSESVPQLITHFEEQVRNNTLTDVSIEPVISTQAGSSLTLYSADNGWEDGYIPPEFKNSIESRRRINSKDVTLKLGCITPRLSNNLNYKVLESPQQAIKVYIKTFKAFSFGNLPIKLGEDYHNSIFTQADLALLAKFFSKKIAGPTFTVRNILNEYSLDLYWVEIPPKWECTAPTFLHLLPWASILSTEKKTILIAPLSLNFLNWIETQLSWQVRQIHSVYRAKGLQEEWYDFQKVSWKVPRLLDVKL
ncbi:MAG: hypothetical protein ACW97Z_08255 [Candidatus Hodarchaeales archaeon]|jgi:hypothetical protein